VFVFDKSFLPTLMFVGKAGAYPRVKQLKCTTPGHSYKHWTSLERPARDKHSSLSQNFVNYGRKKFYSIGPRLE
jgi:hypothetical protein